MKKIVYLDMDSVIADFEGSSFFDPAQPVASQVHKMYTPGFFYGLKPVEGALSGVRAIMRLGYEVHILSRPVAESAHSYTEKAQWIGLYFPELINNVHFTQNKGLFKGDYLIDDDADKWEDVFGGKFIHFEYNDSVRTDWSRPTNHFVWESIIDFFKKEKENELV